MIYKQPIRIHTQGYGADLLIEGHDSSCGDLRGPDCLSVRFDDAVGGFVLSLADLEQAVRAVRRHHPNRRSDDRAHPE